ncbi:FAD/NAD(P)-binding protein [Staphylococcus lugdunensis]|uniref:Pyridine nucleotide-disulfide oxidoreductase n=1 Tax=Staphylococcus lugdunensis TaxID=28035 RepID=A0A4Q9W9F8_STALU|nr:MULTISPECIES: FAD/NAD(P)-binding protein [Staphylococcus]ARJ11211.1 pyridine nucleotide-disulfide oxidoreductase [Staphylococcus lugdunensis]KAK55695.1 FAD-NAD(P)-binding [Staphylococcus lugdunensis VCU148]MBM0804025.1 pyridine nucleotide-disulfide oxidoreductase [Staphylococcus lugdunensis]MCH8661929.1 FAD/NAD(P)-binding protein [Staphylococcus lugdunensis]MCH8683174.1 FAD/NAD(P)-binding protein [Staphylococcus lugdunensis]
MRVAIIGMGTAGVSVLRQLVKHENFSTLTVDVYDNKINMGHGVPFQNDSDELLINLPSKKMSLNLEDDLEFWHWYQQQNIFSYENPKYLPRFIFGHYMKSYLLHFDKIFDNLTLIHDEVKEIFTNSNVDETALKYYVCTSDDMNDWKEYDYIFLTIGTLSYHDPYQLKGILGYIQSPYPTYNTLDEVKETDRIAIIGTGLASLDVVRYVATHHKHLPIIMTSRSAQLPSVRGNMQEITFRYLTKQTFNSIKAVNYGNVPLDTLVKLFYKECEEWNIELDTLINRRSGNHIDDLQYDLDHSQELGVFQGLIEHLKENLNWIYNSLSSSDQQLFDKKYTKVIQLNSNPMPPRTAKLLIELMQNGSLIIKRGLENITHDGQLFNLTFKDTSSCDDFNIIINATGAKTHLAELDEDDQLVINLENRRIVQAHPMGGIQIVPETNQIISPRYGTLTNAVAIGQLTNGVNKLRNGVKMIVSQVVNAVDYLYEHQSRLSRDNISKK